MTNQEQVATMATIERLLDAKYPGARFADWLQYNPNNGELTFAVYGPDKTENLYAVVGHPVPTLAVRIEEALAAMPKRVTPPTPTPEAE